MKKNTLYILLLLTINTFSQSAIKFVNPETNEPVCSTYATIYKNGDTFENCGGSNKDGFLKLRIRKIDTTATYHFSFNNIKYKPVWKEIDLKNKDTLTVFLRKDKYYIENHKGLLYKSCGVYVFPNYQPREPRSLSEIPDSIAIKVKTYLKERVGREIFKKFHFLGGQTVDIREYNKRNPKFPKYISYYLCFSYRNIDAGIGMYSSNIHLDEYGDILKDIEFPKIQKNSIQEKIVSLNSVKNKAIKKGFYNDKTKISMSYMVEENILVWKFRNETYNQNNTFIDKELIYNAHTGSFIKININKGTWIE